MVIKKKGAIEKMRVAGRLLAQIMAEIESYLVPGVSTFELDRIIENKMMSLRLKPECKGYAGYKYATCISLNDGIVHGVPSKSIILKSGDFVKIDVVGSHGGYCVDMSRYFFVEKASEEARKIACVAQKALDIAIAKIIPGVMVSEVSSVIQDFVELHGYSVIRDYAGHGIGKNLHEIPEIPNYRRSGEDFVLLEGMTLAIEPMIAYGEYKVKVLDDGWTAKTADGSLAAHVEDTVVVVQGGTEVLTRV